MPEPAPNLPFRVPRRVEFCDTDAAGIVHFSAFFRYMEQAEHELLRSVGLSVLLSDAEGKISWPRVAARCDYQSPARFDEMLDIDVSIPRLGRSSVTYRFVFRRGEQLLATGEMTSVCCRIPADGPPKSLAIPDWFAVKLVPFLEPK